GIDALRRMHILRQKAYGAGEALVRTLAAENREPRRHGRGFANVENHGRGSRGREHAVVLRGGQDRKIAGAGPLERGHAGEVDVAVAFDPAAEFVGQLTQLHKTESWI